MIELIMFLKCSIKRNPKKVNTSQDNEYTHTEHRVYTCTNPIGKRFSTVVIVIQWTLQHKYFPESQYSINNAGPRGIGALSLSIMQFTCCTYYA